MMTLDEAIKHCEETARRVGNLCKDYPTSSIELVEDGGKCAEEHRQLAEWLKELKAYREQDKAIAEAIKQGVVWDFEQYNRLEQMKQHRPNFSNFISSACRMCANNPMNGGSGICHCTLGMSQIN